MTSQINIGVNNNKKIAKDFYIGIDNKPRKVLKGWIGVNNKPRLFYTSSSLPKYYEPVDWIMNNYSASQLINTEVLCDSNTRIILEIEFVQLQMNSCFCGIKLVNLDNNSILPNYSLQRDGSTGRIKLNYGNLYIDNVYVSEGATTDEIEVKTHYFFDLNRNGSFILKQPNKLTGEYVEKIFYTSNTKYDNDYIKNPDKYSDNFPYFMIYGHSQVGETSRIPSGVFYNTINPTLKFKLYNCQIYQNNILIRNFIPCRDTSTELGWYTGCLYDTVNRKIYKNTILDIDHPQSIGFYTSYDAIEEDNEELL